MQAAWMCPANDVDTRRREGGRLTRDAMVNVLDVAREGGGEMYEYLVGRKQTRQMNSHNSLG